jgi:citrate synthase
MTTGALAARMTYHSAPEALQGAVAAAILGAGSVHLGSSEYSAKMLNDALPPDSKETELDAIAKNTVEKRLANKQLIPGIGHGIHTQGDPRAEKLFQVAQETKVYGRYCDLLRKIGKLAEERVGRRLPVNVTGAIAAISMDMGLRGRCPSRLPFSAVRWAASPTSAKKFAVPLPAASRIWFERICSTSRRSNRPA